MSVGNQALAAAHSRGGVIAVFKVGDPTVEHGTEKLFYHGTHYISQLMNSKEAVDNLFDYLGGDNEVKKMRIEQQDDYSCRLENHYKAIMEVVPQPGDPDFKLAVPESMPWTMLYVNIEDDKKFGIFCRGRKFINGIARAKVQRCGKKLC
jgi:hypothetical protein